MDVLDLYHFQRLGGFQFANNLAHGGDVRSRTRENHGIGSAINNGAHAVVAAAAILFADVHVVEQLDNVRGSALLQLDCLEVTGERAVVSH